MGGSSLCPEVLRSTFGPVGPGPALLVLDSTVPETIVRIESQISLPDTLFIVSSKSGSTIEVQSLLAYFWEKCPRGEQYIAITDAGSSLSELATSRKFRHLFINPSDIGGRFSALSYFGMVPAAVSGIGVDALIASAQGMISACGPDVPAERNPGVQLGLTIGEAAKVGQDKLTIFLSPEIRTFGWWIEQLVAESTGKDGQGVLPIVDEPAGDLSVYGVGRYFVYLRLADTIDTALDARIAKLTQAGMPVTTIGLASRFDLGAEFFRWEVATAVASAILGVNAFDEPNVSESKQLTGELLAHVAQHGQLPAQTPLVTEERLALFVPQAPAGLELGNIKAWLDWHLGRLTAGDYLGVLAYLDDDQPVVDELTRLRCVLRDRYHAPTSLGFGPRFLHSTGQLHKGGPNSGVFVQLTAAESVGLPIPGAGYDFGTLNRAQADGDYLALLKHGRRCIRLTLRGDVLAALRTLTKLATEQ